LQKVVHVREGNASEKDAVNHARVAGVEKAERGAITLPGGANEGVVGAGGSVRGIHGRWTGAGGTDF
jgi:hypothetical protein